MEFTQKYIKSIIAVSVFLSALTAISVSPYRLAFKYEMDAVAASVQTIECRDIQVRLNDSYMLRQEFMDRREPIPQWLKTQIADYEVYIRAFC